MKTFLFFIGLFIILSCKSKSDATSDTTGFKKDTLAVHHSENIDLTKIYVLKNACLSIKTDANGSLYKNVEDGKNLVVEIVYYKPGPDGTADGNYKEVIAFEIPDKTTNLSLKDDQLKEAKLVFARFCYCKRANRFLPVTNGFLRVTKKDSNLTIKLDFEVRKSEQILKQIDETIQLK